MKKKHVWVYVILGIIALLLVVLLVNRKVVSIVCANLFNPTYHMDESNEWEGGASFIKVPYAEDSSEQYLDLYVPDNVTNPPLFVLVHGGGFVSNDSQSRQAQWMYRYFRDQGFACATINYRLAAEAPFPAACADVKAAVRFLGHNAEQYGYDSERIAIWGESAGGYLASFTALTEPFSYADVLCIGETAENRYEMPSFDALVDYYGIMDFSIASELFSEEDIPAWLVSVANGWARENVGDFASFEEFWLRKGRQDWGERELNDASVLYHAAHDEPGNPDMKTLIVHGTADITVSHLQSVQLEKTLREKGRNVTVRLVPDCGHASDKLFTDEMLSEVKQFLLTAFEQ